MATIKQRKIDAQKLREFVNAHGGQTAVAEQLGRSGTFFWNVFQRGKISLPDLYLLCGLYNLPRDTFDTTPEQPEFTAPEHTESGNAYKVGMAISGGTLRLTICAGEIEVDRAYAQIRENSDVGVSHALSVAARLLYESVNQRALAAEFEQQ